MTNAAEEFVFDDQNLDLYLDEFEEFEDFSAENGQSGGQIVDNSATIDFATGAVIPSSNTSFARKESSKTLKKPTMGTVLSKEEQMIQEILKAENERVQGLLSVIKLEKNPLFTIFEQTPFGENENGETLIQSLKYGTLLSNAGVQAPSVDDLKEVGTNTPKKIKQEDFGAQAPEDRYIGEKSKKERNMSVLEKIRNDFGTSASFKKFVSKAAKVCDRILTVNDVIFGNDLENSKNGEIHHSKIDFSLNSFAFSHETLTKTRKLQDFFVTGNSQLICAYSKSEISEKSENSLISYPGVILIWSLSSQTVPEKILVSFSEISCVSYFTNQKSEFVVAGTKDGTINVWDISNEIFDDFSENSEKSENNQKFVEIMEEKILLTNGKEKFSKTLKTFKIFLRLPSYTTDWLVFDNHKSEVKTIIPTISPFQKDDLQFYSIDSTGLIIFWALSLVASATETILGGFSLSDVLSNSNYNYSSNNFNSASNYSDLGFGTFSSHVKLSKLAFDNLFENDVNLLNSVNCTAFACDPRRKQRYYVATDSSLDGNYNGIIFSHSRFERENLPPKLYKPFDFSKEILEGTASFLVNKSQQEFAVCLAFIPQQANLEKNQISSLEMEKIPSFFFSGYSNGIIRLFRTDYEYPIMESSILEGNTPLCMLFHPTLADNFLFVFYLKKDQQKNNLSVAVLKVNNFSEKVSMNLVFSQNLEALGNVSMLKNAMFFSVAGSNSNLNVNNAKVHLVLGFENGEVQFHEVDKSWAGFVGGKVQFEDSTSNLML